MSESPNWYIPDYPPLKYSDLVGRAAVEGQIVTYPKVVRTTADPPIINQTIGNISFMLFDQPKKTKSGKPIYGFLKVRGAWNGEQIARSEASKIIREVDSKFPIKLSPIGMWVPITEDDDSAKEKIDVKTNEEEIQLRDEAIREKNAERRKIQHDLEERRKELEEGGDVYDDPTSLRYYTMRMVTSIRLREEKIRLTKQLSDIEINVDKVNRDLYKLEKTHPEYKEEWVDCYNIERKKSGIMVFVPDEEFIKYHDENIKKLEPSSIECGEKEE